MLRTVELGRAVLTSQDAHLQLWFTTLITVSPQQNSIDIQQFNWPDLLRYLLSEDVWVCRGSGMHIVIELCIQGKPAGYPERRELADRIVKAPVWDQLDLKASIPVDELDSRSPETSLIRVNISHTRNHADSHGKPLHRIQPNVPFADIKPPDGVPTIALHSIRLAADIIFTNPRCSAVKGPRHLETFVETEAPEVRHPQHTSLHASRTSLDGKSALQCNREGRKRKRSSVSSNVRGTSPRCVHPVTKLKQPQLASRLAKFSTDMNHTVDISKVEQLIDGALRISVGKGAPKLPKGIKIAVNAFAGSLSGISPALWAPGYLSSMSERAALLPTIGRALVRIASSSSKSQDLKAKLVDLASMNAEQRSNVFFSAESSTSTDHNLVDPIQARLWKHSQGRLHGKCKGSLLPFLSCPGKLQDQFDSDNLLDHEPTHNVWHDADFSNQHESEPDEAAGDEKTLLSMPDAIPRQSAVLLDSPIESMDRPRPGV